MILIWSKIPIISANALGWLLFGRGAVLTVKGKVLPVEGKVSPVEGKGDEKECSETENANRANRGKTREQEAEMSQLNKVISCCRCFRRCCTL